MGDFKDHDHIGTAQYLSPEQAAADPARRFASTSTFAQAINPRDQSQQKRPAP